MSVERIDWGPVAVRTYRDDRDGQHWRVLSDGREEPYDPVVEREALGIAGQEQPARRHLRDRLLTLDALASLPPVRPLVEGLLYRDTLAQLAGPPGSYKSFVSVGVACAVAAGVPWEGHRVPRAGHVVYVAPEGSNGLRARVLAWCESNRVAVEKVARHLHVLREPLGLGEASDVSEAVEVAAELGALLLVLDTRARCTLGLEENSATEQGIAIAAAERIQRASGGTVLGVHHSGRTGDAGRGSNAWDGAVWSDLRIKGAELRCVVHCEKHKDVPDGCEHHFRLLPHLVSREAMPRWTDEDGQPVSDEEWERGRSTLVAVQTGHLDQPDDDSASNLKVLDIALTSAGTEGLTRAQLVTLAVEAGIGRSTAYGAVPALVKRGALRNVGTESKPKYVPTGAYSTAKED